MEKRVFVAIGLCVLIFVAWQKLFIDPYLEAQQRYQAATVVQNTTSTVNQTPAVSKTVEAKAAPVKTSAPVQLITFKSPGLTFDISTQGGVVSNLRFGDFRGKNTDQVESMIAGGGQLILTTNSAEWQNLANLNYAVASKSDTTLNLVYEDEAIKVTRRYQFVPNLLSLDHTADIVFKRQPAPQFVFTELRSKRDVGEVENERRELIVNKAKGHDTHIVGDVDETIEDVSQIHWLGFASRYFLNGLVDQSVGDTKPQFQAKPLGNDWVSASLIYKVNGNTAQVATRSYFGPKEIEQLKEANPRLGAAVDFGWFTFFAYPLLQGLKWFYKYVHNFGIAIILLTIVIKLLTYPLTYKSMKSMKDMQRIQPQLARLREKYADDKEALNREMLQLMRANGYNPLSGCLPMLIQMPIFIALYNVLYNSIELYGQPFFGWIHDLSQKDPYFVTPVLLALMMYVQQKLTPSTATDPAQQRMMNMMPLIFGVMMLWLPSGLTLYMLVNSIVSILQQVAITKSIDRAVAA